MGEKRSSREIFESTKTPKRERVYIQFPGEEMQDVTLFSLPFMSHPDYKKISELKEQHPGEKYSFRHNHPDKGIFGTIVPSSSDLQIILNDREIKTGGIAQQDYRTGKLKGYLIIKPSKKAKRMGNFSSLFYDVASIISPSYATGWIQQKYGLRFRFLPAEGYKLNKRGTKFIPRGGEDSGLTKRVAIIITISALTLSILLISPNLTGNTIGLNPAISNWIGILLFILGIVGAFWYFKIK